MRSQAGWSPLNGRHDIGLCAIRCNALAPSQLGMPKQADCPHKGTQRKWYFCGNPACPFGFTQQTLRFVEVFFKGDRVAKGFIRGRIAEASSESSSACAFLTAV